MSVLTWDDAGKHFFENGVDQGVLYAYNAATTEATTPTTKSNVATYMSGNHKYTGGVAWNGLTAFNESPDGGDANDIYADNIKYLSLRGTENFKFSIEAYTYPDEFAQYNGEKRGGPSNAIVVTGQGRNTFGFACRTKIGNDETADYGYKIHLIYGVTCSPSDRSYETINDSPDAINFSWDCETIPVDTGITIDNKPLKPTAHVTITVKSGVSDAGIAQLEKAVFGDTSTPAFLPLPKDVYAILGINYA